MRPPTWQEESLMSNFVSETNLRNPWWPEHDQTQTRNLPANMYNGAVNWGPMPPNQLQHRYQRPPPHLQQPLSNGMQQSHLPSVSLHATSVQQQLYQPHSSSIPRQQEPQLHQVSLSFVIIMLHNLSSTHLSCAVRNQCDISRAPLHQQ